MVKLSLKYLLNHNVSNFCRALTEKRISESNVLEFVLEEQKKLKEELAELKEQNNSR